MQRWYFLAKYWKGFTVSLGLLMTVTLLSSWGDTRIIIKTFWDEETSLKKAVCELDPKSPEELRGDFWIAMQMDAKVDSPSSGNVNRLLEWLCGTPTFGGNKVLYPRKAWVTEELVQELQSRAWEASRWGGSPYDHKPTADDPDYWAARSTWKWERHWFWIKVATALGAGAGTICLSFLLIPILILVSLIGGVAVGKVSTPESLNKHVAYHQTNNPTGGDGSHAPPPDGTADVSEHPGSWPVVLAIGTVVVLINFRRRIRAIGRMTSRAPPTIGGCHDSLVRDRIAAVPASPLGVRR